MVDATIDWTELREFRAVELTRSFVLSWEVEGDALLIDLDLSLCPEHAFYEKPRPAEIACYRAAILEFPCCTEVTHAMAGENEAGSMDIVGNLTHGKISGFQLVADGKYRLSGDFGTITIVAERPLLRLKGPVA